MKTCPICKKKKTSFFTKKENYSYFYCKSCDTLFIDPIPSQKFIDHFYDKGYPYKVDSISSRRMRQNAVKIMKRLTKLHPSGKTLLDVGSGYGDFLDVIKKTTIDGVGIEPAANLYNFSRKRKLKVIRTTLNEFSKANKNLLFDFITVIHLIEHVKNPTQFISQCLRHLKKGGIMYIETPNVASHLFNAEKESYTFLTPPDHTILVSPMSLNKILLQKNLEIEDLSTFSFPEHVSPILKRIRGKKVIKPLKVSKDATTSNSSQKKTFRYFIGNRFLYPLFTPIMNLGSKGSILACYIRKTA